MSSVYRFIFEMDNLESPSAIKYLEYNINALHEWERLITVLRTSPDGCRQFSEYLYDLVLFTIKQASPVVRLYLKDIVEIMASHNVYPQQRFVTAILPLISTQVHRISTIELLNPLVDMIPIQHYPTLLPVLLEFIHSGQFNRLCATIISQSHIAPENTHKLVKSLVSMLQNYLYDKEFLQFLTTCIEKFPIQEDPAIINDLLLTLPLDTYSKPLLDSLFTKIASWNTSIVEQSPIIRLAGPLMNNNAVDSVLLTNIIIKLMDSNENAFPLGLLPVIFTQLYTLSQPPEELIILAKYLLLHERADYNTINAYPQLVIATLLKFKTTPALQALGAFLAKLSSVETNLYLQRLDLPAAQMAEVIAFTDDPVPISDVDYHFLSEEAVIHLLNKSYSVKETWKMLSSGHLSNLDSNQQIKYLAPLVNDDTLDGARVVLWLLKSMGPPPAVTSAPALNVINALTGGNFTLQLLPNPKDLPTQVLSRFKAIVPFNIELCVRNKVLPDDFDSMISLLSHENIDDVIELMIATDVPISLSLAKKLVYIGSIEQLVYLTYHSRIVDADVVLQDIIAKFSSLPGIEILIDNLFSSLVQVESSKELLTLVAPFKGSATYQYFAALDGGEVPSNHLLKCFFCPSEDLIHDLIESVASSEDVKISNLYVRLVAYGIHKLQLSGMSLLIPLYLTYISDEVKQEYIKAFTSTQDPMNIIDFAPITNVPKTPLIEELAVFFKKTKYDT